MERYWRYHIFVIYRLPTGDSSLLLPVGGVLREGDLGMWIINVEGRRGENRMHILVDL